MRFGLSVPNFGPFGDPLVVAELAEEAEARGWDGFFLWDHIAPEFGPDPRPPVVDPWIALAAAAVRTRRIRLGTLVTPLARRRPVQVARQTVALDRLSAGRFTLGVGLGDPPETEFEKLGEDPDPVARAERLDESLDVLLGLWTGEPFSYRGRHQHIDDVVFLPRCVQEPRVPIWVAAMWPNRRPVRRAARFEGVVPISADWDAGGTLSPSDVAEIRAYIGDRRSGQEPFDIVVGQEYEKGDLEEFGRAGVTWWMDSDFDLAALRDRIATGPPTGAVRDEAP